MTPTPLTWRKSSYSENGGACVEVATSAWRTSSYSNNGGQCVEIAPTPTTTLIRDSKSLPDAPTLRIPTPAFTAFLASL
ncbi:DUF397 domain-containing protein [Streptomyces niveiscabiei]|uniref:DUF397 domain-containing protein n=1 Tax=Streptomyces niveiscabiei TaxID=164115 RepID=UPI0029AD4945|nr:DUF397 domain-containing protein [Streptomyces niveiscabiei]MDX3387627.1 DUF397 domain-containing protein [Streptomyces niveiscabiei]